MKHLSSNDRYTNRLSRHHIPLINKQIGEIGLHKYFCIINFIIVSIKHKHMCIRAMIIYPPAGFTSSEISRARSQERAQRMLEIILRTALDRAALQRLAICLLTTLGAGMLEGDWPRVSFVFLSDFFRGSNTQDW